MINISISEQTHDDMESICEINTISKVRGWAPSETTYRRESIVDEMIQSPLVGFLVQLCAERYLENKQFKHSKI